MPIVAWYVLSKESYMNRVIKDVLPTVAAISPYVSDSSNRGHMCIPLCSPRNTSLQPVSNPL
jgi:hypothetical protein